MSYLTEVGCQARAAEVSVAPRSALVFSEVCGGRSSHYVATHHDIEPGETHHQMSLGRAVSPDGVRQMLAEFGLLHKAAWLPTRVLALGPSGLVWYRPSERRPMHFRYGAHAVSLDVVWPSLIFSAKNTSLRIYALPSAERPEPTTPLLKAPLGNLDADGEMCWGGITPIEASVANLKQLEDAVFQTHFSHGSLEPVVAMDLPRDHQEFFDMLVFWRKHSGKAAAPLPLEMMLPARLRAGDLL